MFIKPLIFLLVLKYMQLIDSLQRFLFVFLFPYWNIRRAFSHKMFTLTTIIYCTHCMRVYSVFMSTKGNTGVHLNWVHWILLKNWIFMISHIFFTFLENEITRHIGIYSLNVSVKWIMHKFYICKFIPDLFIFKWTNLHL